MVRGGKGPCLGNPPPNERTRSQSLIKNIKTTKKGKSGLWFPLLALFEMTANPFAPLDPPSPFAFLNWVKYLTPLLQGKANNTPQETSFISKPLGRRYK